MYQYMRITVQVRFSRLIIFFAQFRHVLNKFADMYKYADKKYCINIQKYEIWCMCGHKFLSTLFCSMYVQFSIFYRTKRMRDVFNYYFIIHVVYSLLSLYMYHYRL